MNEIALVFFTFWLHDPSVIRGPEISANLFENHEACADFVNSIANNDTDINVVDENYEFKFASIDGLVFVGGCYSAAEYEKKILKRS